MIRPDVNGESDDVAVCAEAGPVHASDRAAAPGGQGRCGRPSSSVHVLYGQGAERAVAQGVTRVAGI